MSEKKKIKFNKYNSEETFKQDEQVDNATFSVVRTVIDEDGDDTNDIKDLYLHRTKLTDRYNSRVTKEDAVTSVTVGGLNAGTPLSELKEMSLGQVIDKMLFKTYAPSYTSPTLTITGPSGSKLVGTSYPAISGHTEDRGRYTNYNNGLSYAGDPVSGSFIGTNISGGTVGTSEIRISASIRFSEGPVPKDSDGNPYEGANIPYPGGIVQSNTLVITPYYNWFATGDKVTNESVPASDDFYTTPIDIRTLGSVNYMGIREVTVMLDVCGGNINKRQTIKVPGTVSECKTYLNGTWVNYAFDDWYGEEGPETINGKSYNVYKMKPEAFASGPVGGTRLKFKIIP